MANPTLSVVGPWFAERLLSALMVGGLLAALLIVGWGMPT